MPLEKHVNINKYDKNYINFLYIVRRTHKEQYIGSD